MDCKIKQRVCIKFCVKLHKSATGTLEELEKAFGEHSSSQIVVFDWYSRLVERQLKMMKVQVDQAPEKR
jgi:hypothetical protein